MPRFERLPEFKMDALVLNLAAEREAEFGLRLIPFSAEIEAMTPEIADSIG